MNEIVIMLLFEGYTERRAHVFGDATIYLRLADIFYLLLRMDGRWRGKPMTHEGETIFFDGEWNQQAYRYVDKVPRNSKKPKMFQRGIAKQFRELHGGDGNTLDIICAFSVIFQRENACLPIMQEYILATQAVGSLQGFCDWQVRRHTDFQAWALRIVLGENYRDIKKLANQMQFALDAQVVFERLEPMSWRGGVSDASAFEMFGADGERKRNLSRANPLVSSTP